MTSSQTQLSASNWSSKKTAQAFRAPTLICFEPNKKLTQAGQKAQLQKDTLRGVFFYLNLFQNN
jgi:hypothetical protein